METSLDYLDRALAAEDDGSIPTAAVDVRVRLVVPAACDLSLAYASQSCTHARIAFTRPLAHSQRIHARACIRMSCPLCVHQPGTMRRQKGAYRFTSLLDKLKKWRMLTTRAVKELDTPAVLPPECDDPKQAEVLLVSTFREARESLEDIVRGAASMVSVAEYGRCASYNLARAPVSRSTLALTVLFLTSCSYACMRTPRDSQCRRSSGSLDFTIVEEKLVGILRQLVALVRTFKLVAALDDTTPVSISAVRTVLISMVREGGWPAKVA
jgi:hypothetical protein